MILLLAASKLIRNDKEFQRLVRDLEMEVAKTPLISKRMNRHGTMKVRLANTYHSVRIT
jgi:hypothetical protein